jgi:hypothetical protein
MNDRRLTAYNVLLNNGAPPQAVARIIREMDEAEVFDVPSSTNADQFYRDATESLVEAVTTLDRVDTLATEFEGSKSPAIRGAGKKLRAVLDSPA